MNKKITTAILIALAIAVLLESNLGAVFALAALVGYIVLVGVREGLIKLITYLAKQLHK